MTPFSFPIHHRRIPFFTNNPHKLLIFLLSLNLILSSNVFFGSHNFVDSWTIFSTAAVEREEENYFGSRPVDFDRTDIPKNILVGSYIGGVGHLRPPLEIGKILIERGYNVALVAPGNFTPSPEYPNVRQFSTGPKFDTRTLPAYQKLFTEEYTFKKFRVQRKLSNSEYLNRFQIYMQAAAEFKPDLFLCDFLMNEACYDVAWKLKKPVVGISTGLTPRSYAPYRSDPSWSCHANMENEPFAERFRCAVIVPIMIIYESRVWVNELNEIRSKVGVSPVSSSIERVKDSLFFADTFFGFEVPHHLPPLVQEIGPVMQDEYPPITPSLSAFLSTHKRTMFVSFGILVHTTPENNAILLSSFVEAINQGVIDGVIWSLVQTSHDDIPSNITLSDGTVLKSTHILHNKHPHIHITDFAPQFALLNQTNVKLFFSHGGTGSSHESIYTAKPMLLLPIVFDQMGNAEKLENAGVGLTVSKFDLSVQDIVDKIKKLQTDESIQVNVRRMQVLARINSKRKYRAADLIEFLLLASQLNNEDDEYDEEEEGVMTNNDNTLVVEGDSENRKSISDKNNINNENGKTNKKNHNNNNSKSKSNHLGRKGKSGNGDGGYYLTYANAHLRELITPDTRMGLIKGKYLDVFGTLVMGIIVVVFSVMWLVWVIASIFVNSVLNLTESFVGEPKIKDE